MLLKEHDPLLVVGLSALKVSDLLILEHGLFVHLFNPVFKLLVLVKQKLGIVSSFGISIIVYKFLKFAHLYFEFLILDGIVLNNKLLLAEFVLLLINLFLRFAELTIPLQEHSRKQLNLLVLVFHDLG